MDQKIFLSLMNVVFLILVLPIALFVISISTRARRGVRLTRAMLVDYVPSPEGDVMLMALECAEDHRFRSHWGIDPIAVTRAIMNRLMRDKLQGASTIEQQFVRTCTELREITFTRKIEEMAIAIFILIGSDKSCIAYSYLSCAYFGEGLRGYKAAISVLFPDKNGAPLTRQEAAAIVALLKRPRPASEDSSWKYKHS